MSDDILDFIFALLLSILLFKILFLNVEIVEDGDYRHYDLELREDAFSREIENGSDEPFKVCVVRKACKELNVSRWGLYKFIKEEGYRIEKKIGLVRIDE